MNVIEVFKKIKDVIDNRIANTDSQIDVNELIINAVNESNLDEDLKDLFLGLFTYTVDNAGILSDLYDYLTELTVKNMELVDEVDPEDHPMEYLNYSKGSADTIILITKWLNSKFEAAEANEMLEQGEIGIVRAEDYQ